VHPAIDTIHTRTRTLELGEVDGVSLLQRLYATSTERTASLLFELDHDGGRVAVICDAPLYTIAIHPTHTLLHAHSTAPQRLEHARGGVELLRALLAAYQQPLSGLSGLAQAMFAIFAYDAARQFEPKLDAQRHLDLPDIWAMIPRTCVVVQQGSGHAVAIANAIGAAPDEAALDHFIARLHDRSADTASAAHAPTHPRPQPRAITSPEHYRAAVERAREYIQAGDIFQVVLSVEGACEIDEPATTLFRRMAEVNRHTANMLVETPMFTLVGASPEILVEKRGRECIIRPLAGTLAHAGVRDPELEAQLLGDEKECAEHRMLVDLARNDLGRVCEYGTVLPRRLMTIEWFYNVLHISSEIRGVIRDDRDALDLLINSFPAGTMTGTPKIRAMQIIDELEATARGFYSGGIGFLTANGDLLTYISIRSLIIRDGIAFARAGSGIVYDSEPDREYRECLTKLQNAWRALLGPEASS
jgi:anthranilate/para-aminobenzoate synthase component I